MTNTVVQQSVCILTVYIAVTIAVINFLSLPESYTKISYRNKIPIILHVNYAISIYITNIDFLRSPVEIVVFYADSSVSCCKAC